MTAIANGGAHARAIGRANAVLKTSVHAKISQSQSQARREPEPEPEPELEPDRKTRVAGFTTSSSCVPREVGQPRAGHPRDVMVSATRIDEATGLIEHLDFPIPCCTIRCVEDVGNAADYIVVAASPWTKPLGPHPWEVCRECYEIGNAHAAALGLGPAWRIVEVLR